MLPMLRSILLLALLASPAVAQDTRPITTAKGPAADLLRQWWAEGKCAGNAGDWYDNRDRAHSDLQTANYPQLQRHVYTEEQLKVRADWAASGVVLPKVVFGNSSTSAPATNGGSNPRRLYSDPRGMALLYQQYTRNNLYIYPEHQDHDPGRFGAGGWGDLFPTNTPYLLISQGSSGTDQPFMRAVPFTLAAFKPEVKKKLIDSGLLMPTLQMILRASNKHLKAPGDYLTGKAHPVVFEGAWVDELAMVKLAQQIKLDDIPPMVKLRVAEEREFLDPSDMREAGAAERLADTPGVIARIWRSRTGTRTMVVNAEQSLDVNGRPLKFHWKLLRGDEKTLSIKTLNDAGTIAEITLNYPQRIGTITNPGVTSSRIDIGVFAHNGAYYSAPAFITYAAIDSESRIHDKQGRAIEIAHGMGQTGVSVHNWLAVFDELGAETPSPGIALLRDALGAEKLKALGGTADAYRKAVVDATTMLKVAEGTHAAARNATSEAALKVARDAFNKADQAGKKLLDERVEAIKASPREAVEGVLLQWMRDPALYAQRLDLIRSDDARVPELKKLRGQLVGWGVIEDGRVEQFKLTAATLSPHQRMMLERFNAEIIAGMLFKPGLVQSSFTAELVDPRLAWPKHWRDVYQYEADGRLAGWVRYDGTVAIEYSAHWGIVMQRDRLGRTVMARPVTYERKLSPRGTPEPVRIVPASRPITIEYAGDEDRVGRSTTR